MRITNLETAVGKISEVNGTSALHVAGAAVKAAEAVAMASAQQNTRLELVAAETARSLAEKMDEKFQHIAEGEQRRDDLGVALLAGQDERREAIAVNLVNLGVRSEQRRGDLGMALMAGHDERRDAIGAGLVRVGVRSKQRRDDLGVAELAGEVQWGGAIFAGVHVADRRAVCEQLHNGLRVAIGSGAGKRREMEHGNLHA